MIHGANGDGREARHLLRGIFGYISATTLVFKGGLLSGTLFVNKLTFDEVNKCEYRSIVHNIHTQYVILS